MQNEAFDVELETLSNKPHILRRIFSGLRPFMTQALRDEQIERDKIREEKGHQLKALQDAANLGRGAELKKAAARAFAEVERLEPAYEAAVAKWRQASEDLQRFNHDSYWRQQRIVNELRATADELIDDTIRTLRKLHHQGLERRPVDYEAITERTRDGKRVTIGVKTDRGSLFARQAAILAAINTADAMKEDVDLSDIAERLRALVEGLPSPDTIVDEIFEGAR